MERDPFYSLCFFPFGEMDVDFFGGTRLNFPRVVLRVLPLPHYFLHAWLWIRVLSLVDIVERKQRRICQATAGHGESGLTVRHCRSEQIGVDVSIEAMLFGDLGEN